MEKDRQDTNKIDISIVIVSWNTKKLLDKCLRSIYENKSDLKLEIFVVDNNSSDNTIEMIKDKYVSVMIIANDKNRGFAVANNQAIKKAKGEYILLLNPDTEILENGLSKSLNFMKTHSQCGAMGPRMLFTDKSLQPSVRRFPTIWPIFLMLIKAPKIFKKIKSLDYYLYKDFDYNKEQEVDQIMGAFMMIPRKIFGIIGLLDERFFIWFEEVDLCKRISQAKYQVIYNPKVKIIHHGGKSFEHQGAVKKQLLFFKSAYKYFLKYNS